jgi:hypothetical protein
MKALLAATLLAISMGGMGIPANAALQSKVPHPEGGMQMLGGGKFSPTGYRFRFHVTGYTLSELKFIAPEGMSLSRSISIYDKSGQAVPATVEVQGQIATISFTQPVALDSKLNIQLNQVKTIDNSRIWELETSARLGDLKTDIPLQTIRLSPSSFD